MAISSDAKAIARLRDKVEASENVSDTWLQRWESLLIERAKESDDVTITGDDCPDNNDDCDPPGTSNP